ncbi:MAG: isoprenylcysteine carboxylmethyltransferase family protein [Terracidiphilus sp.]
MGFGIAWGTMMAVWLASAPFAKAKARDTSSTLRLVQGAMMLAGYVLIGGWGHLGWLSRPLWQQTWTVAWTGLGITCAGIVYAIWARLTLGSNWSAKPMVKHGHDLVVSGPYSLTRHPIYTGLLLAAAGTGLAVAEVRSAVGVATLLAAMLIKIRQEEQLMTETFPEAYPAYRLRVKALVPMVW